MQWISREGELGELGYREDAVVASAGYRFTAGTCSSAQRDFLIEE